MWIRSERTASGAKSVLAGPSTHLVSDRATLIPSCSSIQGGPESRAHRVTLRHELTLIVSEYGPKVSVEVPKDAVSPVGLDPGVFALIVTLPVL